jgi:hypothetical protein
MTEPIVHKMFQDTQPGPNDKDVDHGFVQMARYVSKICATRILLMIAVITGSAIWGYTIYDPAQARLYAAIAFSLVFVLPQVALYWKRG